ncbi:uncharacterized protein proser2 [Stigmatopora nigra]
MSKALPSPSGLIQDMANNQGRSRLNGALRRSSKSRDEDALGFLSPEEKECLQFFEKTIGSLESGLEEDELGAAASQGSLKSTGSPNLPAREMDGDDLARVPPLSTGSFGAKDQDIIDLVRPDPDLMLAKLPVFKPTSPDFQKMTYNPDSHFEMKMRHDHSDEHVYQPAGLVPTPVLIAKKIAEDQAGAAGSSLLRGGRGHEGEKSAGRGEDVHSKQGPPTFAKPSRYPANISMILGNKEQQNPPAFNINLNDRRALVMSNLTGGAQVLPPEQPKANLAAKKHGPPARSISFKDPTPEQTRMEALSKLGLTGNRARSAGDTMDGAAPGPVPTTVSAMAALAETRSRVSPRESGILTPDSQIYPSGKKAVSPSWELPRKPAVSPPRAGKTSPHASPSDIASLELNSFGGKSIVVTPGPAKKEPAFGSEAQAVPRVTGPPGQFNSYGGKSTMVSPASGGGGTAAAAKGHLPDILSSHIQVNPRARLPPAELNSYGGKSQTIEPAASKGPAPSPAPRIPPASRGPADALAKTSSKPKQKPAPMFRSQGITVQFSGRGANEDSRKQALKQLGLLKES